MEQKKTHRNRKLKNHMIVACATLCLIALFSHFLGSFLSKANEKESAVKPEVKCFKSVMVKYGETLDDVAKEYFNEKDYASVDAYLDEIISINLLYAKDTVTPGQFVVIPYYTIIEQSDI